MNAKNDNWEKRIDRYFKVFSALLLVAAIVLFPKYSSWTAYSKDGDVIEGANFQLCQTKYRYAYGKCSYISLLFGLGTGMTESEPELPEKFEGVIVEKFHDGRCTVSAKTSFSSLLISQEKGRGDPGSARYDSQINTSTPVVFFSVQESTKPEQALTYREPGDSVSWELERFYGRSYSQHPGKGWHFSEEHDQIVRLEPVIYESAHGQTIWHEKKDIFSDKALASEYERGVTTRAFKWRDNQLSDFSSFLKIDIPKDCNGMRWWVVYMPVFPAFY